MLTYTNVRQPILSTTHTFGMIQLNQQEGKQKVGVELDQPIGKHNGKSKGHLYFKCPKKCGVLATPTKVKMVIGPDGSPVAGAQPVPAAAAAPAEAPAPAAAAPAPKAAAVPAAVNDGSAPAPIPAAAAALGGGDDGEPEGYLDVDTSAINDEGAGGDEDSDSYQTCDPDTDPTSDTIVPGAVAAAQTMWTATETPGELMAAGVVAKLLGGSGLPQKQLRTVWSEAKAGAANKSAGGTMNIEEFTLACELAVKGGGIFA